MSKELAIFNYHIHNAGNSTAEIHIDGDIVDAQTQQLMRDWWGDETSVSFRSFRDQVNASDASTFNIYVNSYGGHVGDAMAIHDLIQELQSKGKTVNTTGRGIVASAATYIVMAGKNSSLTKNTMFLIHPVSGGMYGNVNEMENYVNGMRKFNDMARDFYANKTGMRKEDITKMMDAETWQTAEEAKNNGFVKSVVASADFKNVIPAEKWQFANKAVLNSYNNAVKTKDPKDELKNFINDKFENMEKTFLQKVMDAVKGVKPAENATGQQIVDGIAAALQPLFDAAPETPAAVDNSEDIAKAISASIEEAMKPFNQRLNDLVNTNKGLVTQIENLKGGKTANNAAEEESKDGKRVVGSFGNKKITVGI